MPPWPGHLERSFRANQAAWRGAERSARSSIQKEREKAARARTHACVTRARARACTRVRVRPPLARSARGFSLELPLWEVPTWLFGWRLGLASSWPLARLFLPPGSTTAPAARALRVAASVGLNSDDDTRAGKALPRASLLRLRGSPVGRPYRGRRRARGRAVLEAKNVGRWPCRARHVGRRATLGRAALEARPPRRAGEPRPGPRTRAPARPRAQPVAPGRQQGVRAAGGRW